jgi:hypothetical protein
MRRFAVVELLGGRPRESLKGAEVCERMNRSICESGGDGASRNTLRAGLFRRADAEKGPVNRIAGTARVGIL